MRIALKFHGRSHFRPSGCGVPNFSPERMCAALSAYDAVYLVGDSLLRHLYQGFMVVASGDWERGGFPHAGKLTPKQARDCRCDGPSRFCRGLFPIGCPASHRYGLDSHSRVLLCRSMTGMFSEVRWCRRWHGLPKRGCPAMSRVHYLKCFIPPCKPVVTALAASEETLCDAGRGRTLIVLQGGIHVKLDATRLERNLLRPTIDKIYATAERCDGPDPPKIDVAVLLMGCESRKLDLRFPRQAREHTAAFNAAVASYLRSNYPHVVTLDCPCFSVFSINLYR